MKLNKKLIKQLRNGEIAVENNGTIEQLIEVLEAAFPGTPCPSRSYKFYQKDTDDERVVWDCFYKTNLPIISVSDFYQPELFTGWAKDDRFPEWMAYFKEDIRVYGFNVHGKFDDDYNNSRRYSSDEDNRPATHEEIEQGLAEEAKRRGYKKGNYKCLVIKDFTHDVYGGFYYNEEDNQLHHGKRGYTCNVVFKAGQWAEIVEQPKDKPKTNPIHYTVDGTTYSLNYQDLKLTYESIVSLNDDDFMAILPQIAHLACVVAYFKGLGVQATISDKGIIHELIHLMTEPNEPTNDLQEIREKFNRLIQLV